MRGFESTPAHGSRRAVTDAFLLQVYSARITPLGENVVDMIARLISHSAPCGIRGAEVEPF
jgi:hypothetical protein